MDNHPLSPNLNGNSLTCGETAAVGQLSYPDAGSAHLENKRKVATEEKCQTEIRAAGSTSCQRNPTNGENHRPYNHT